MKWEPLLRIREQTEQNASARRQRWWYVICVLMPKPFVQLGHYRFWLLWREFSCQKRVRLVQINCERLENCETRGLNNLQISIVKAFGTLSGVKQTPGFASGSGGLGWGGLITSFCLRLHMLFLKAVLMLPWLLTLTWSQTTLVFMMHSLSVRPFLGKPEGGNCMKVPRVPIALNMTAFFDQCKAHMCDFFIAQ